MTCSTSASAGRAPSSFKACTWMGMLLVVPPMSSCKKRETLPLAEAAGDAVVEQGDAAVALDEEVAAVQVAVEDAVQQGALRGRRPSRPCSTAAVSIPADRIPSTSSHAKPSSRSITSIRRVTSRGWGRGTMMERWFGLGEDVADVEHVGGLEAEVELLDDRLGEQLDERRRVGERGDRDPPDEERGEEAHAGEVPSHELGDVGTLHLDDHLLAGARAGRRGPGRSRRRRSGSGRTRRRSPSSGPRELGLDDAAHVVE